MNKQINAAGYGREKGLPTWLIVAALVMVTILLLSASYVTALGRPQQVGGPQAEPTVPNPCEGVDCNDGDACTDDYCSNGECYHEEISCDDGDACTDDYCSNGVCYHPLIDCDDGDACTIDYCWNGVCYHAPIDCDDGDACTDDYCSNGECYNIQIDCDDGDDNTIDYCVDGECHHDPICKQNCEDECEENDVVDPVYLHNGEFYLVETDLSIPGQGFPYEFIRKYRSRLPYNGPLGHHWTFNYDKWLLREDDGDIVYFDGFGRRDRYRANGDGTYTSPVGFYTRLVENDDGSLTLRNAQGMTAYFKAFDGSVTDGKITSLVDRNENTMGFVYNELGQLITVLDTLGRPITYRYDADGRLVEVEDFLGKLVRFEYDAAGDLITVTHTARGLDPVQARVTRYTYSSGFEQERLNHNLLTVTSPQATAMDPDGPPSVINTYGTNPDAYDFDRVIRQELNSGEFGCCGIRGVGVVTLAYEPLNEGGDPSDVNLPRSRTVITDSLGNITEYLYNSLGNALQSIEHTTARSRAGMSARVAEYTYNADGERVRVVYPEGNVVEQTYDEQNPDRLQQGNMLVVQEVAEPGPGAEDLVTTYAYEPNFNQIASVTDPLSQTTEYGYDEEGNRVVVTNTLGYTTTSTYDEAGNETSSTDANDSTTTADQYHLSPPTPRFVITPSVGITGTLFMFDASPSSDAEDAPAQLWVRWDWEDNGIYDTPYTTTKTAARSYPMGWHWIRLEVMDSDHLTATVVGTLRATSFAPAATFQVTPTAGYTTTVFSFDASACSDDVDSPADLQVRWDWEDDSVYDTVYTTTKTAFHFYPTLGLKQIRLQVRDSDGLTDTFTNRVTVNPLPMPNQPPDASFVVTPTEGDTSTIFYFDASACSDPEDDPADLRVRWDWDGDNFYDTVYTTTKTTTHTYGWWQVGPQTVHLRVMDSGTLTDTTSRLITINPGPFELYLPLVLRNATGAFSAGTDLESVQPDSIPPVPGWHLATGDRRQPAASAACSVPPLTLTPSPEPLGRVTQASTSDIYQRTVTTTNALDQVTVSVYDAYDNLLSETDANGHTTAYEYNGFNELIKATDALGGETTYTYDLNGNRTSVTDPDGHTTYYAYDLANQLIVITDALGYTTTYTYDPNGNLTAETDANGNTTAYEYDEFNQLVRVVDPLGHETTYEYDANGNRISETDANGNTTTYAYDGFNRLIRVTDPLSYTTRYAYDALGNTVVITDANGKVTYQGYDALSRLVQEIRKVGDTAPVIDPDDAVTTYTYDPVGNLLSVIEPNGNTTTYAYDAANQLVGQTNAAGETTTTTYDPAGNVVQVIATNGNVTIYTYDAMNRLVRVDDSEGRLASYTYDPVSNRLMETDGNGNTVTHTYDALNRPIAVTDAMSETTHYAYDPVGNLVLTTDRNGNATAQAYDALDRRVAITDTLGLTTTYAYDAVGNLLAIADANGQATQYDYDAANRLVTETYADDTQRTFTYDGVGNLFSRTDQNGVTTTYEYNDLYFPTKRDYPDGPDDTFTYDKAGRMLTAERDGWLVTFAYDGANHVVETTQNGQTVRYTYDVANSTRTVFYPGSKVITETMDARARLVQIHDGQPGALVGYTYDAGDRILSRTYRNGVVADYDYNANDWLTNLEHRHGGDLLAGFAHNYDQEGNKLHAENLLPFDPAKKHTHSEKYDYDDVYRLVGFKTGQLVGGDIPTPVGTRAWDLDPVGNWNQFTIDGVAYQNTPNQMNEYDDPSTNGPPPVPDDDGLPDDFKDPIDTPGADGFNSAHDKNGNLVDDDVHTYEYDYENRLTRVTRKADGQVMGEYQYDALGRRVVKIAYLPALKETRLFYDDGRVIEEQDANGVTEATYVYGTWIDDVLSMERGGQVVYYHRTALGSVIGLTDSAGSVAERYHYTAYGCVTVTDGDGNLMPGNPWGTAHSVLGNPYLFTGRRLDEEMGLYYYRARYYDCERGRFLQRDPLGYMDRMNLYEYVRGNPINLNDPSGFHSNLAECYAEADARYDREVEKIKEQAKELYNRLWDAAEKTYKKAMDLAKEGLDNWLAECEKIDRCTLSGSLKYGACKTAAYAAYATATTAATVAVGGATAAIAGEITAFEIGRFAGARALLGIDYAACNKKYLGRVFP